MRTAKDFVFYHPYYVIVNELLMIVTERYAFADFSLQGMGTNFSVKIPGALKPYFPDTLVPQSNPILLL